MNQRQALRQAKKALGGQWSSGAWRVSVNEGFQLKMTSPQASFSAEISAYTDEDGNAIPGQWEVRTYLDPDWHSHGFQAAGPLVGLPEALDVVRKRIVLQVGALQALILPP